jgi:hypothetical protein
MKEVLITLALLAFGLLGLPALVYVVGERVVGPYDGGAGLYDFYQGIGNALAEGKPGAWFLVLSPYLVIQLLRLTVWLQRRRPVT